MNRSNIKNLVRQIILKESSNLLKESMSVSIVDAHDAYKRMDTLEALVSHLLTEVLSPAGRKMPPDQIKYFQRNGVGFWDTLTCDGSYYQDRDGGHGTSGIINFYTSGFTTKILNGILKELFAELRKLGVKWGKITKGVSGSYKNQNVIRIPVLSMNPKAYSGPPEMSLSNRNAYQIFHNLLQYEGEHGFEMEAEELKQRILSLQNDQGWISKNALYTKITKPKEPVEPGDEWKQDSEEDSTETNDSDNPHDAIVNQIAGGLGGATIYNLGMDEDDIKQRLTYIISICDWAIKHGHKKISVG